MNGNGAHRRSEMILLAFAAELDRRRAAIDGDETLTKVVVTIHLKSGGGHPRSIDCQFNSETRFADVDSCGPTNFMLANRKSLL